MDGAEFTATTTRRSASSIARPPRIYTLLEGRGVAEAAALPLLAPWLSRTPRGDGHPVLLVPGFSASDATLVGLRLFLRSRGYEVETWGFGQNTGFKRKFAQALEQKVRFMHHRSGRRVSVVGWSLGGLYAFYLGHVAADCVRSVASLGSPMQLSGSDPATPVVVRALYRWLAHPMGPVAHAADMRAKILRAAPPVPSTCIYSNTDGVVPARAARIDTDDPQHENLWVPGSHIGLGFNAAVMWILADRLAQPEGAWQPFAPKGFAGSLYARLAALPHFF